MQLQYVPVFSGAFIHAMHDVRKALTNELLYSPAVHALRHYLIGQLVGSFQLLYAIVGSS
jgi:hypothetical protein